MGLTKLGALALNYIRTADKSHIIMTKTQNLKNLNFSNLKYSPLKNLNDIGYHGSPAKFDFFDVCKIGSGEGAAKRGIGFYFYRNKKHAPFFANICSNDIPIHFGNSVKIDNPTPHIYTITGFSKLNLKQVSKIEARSIARNQELFEKNNPLIDGIELPSTEICVFPKSINKLSIKYRDELDDFIMMNRKYKFREWTTNPARLKKFI